MTPLETIGAKIRAFRESKGLSQVKLARECGCHVNTVISAEKGRGVNLGTVMKLAKALGTSVGELTSVP